MRPFANNCSTTIIIILAGIFAQSCKPTRYLKENQALIQKVKLEGFDKEQKEIRSQSYSLIRQTPNRSVLGLFKPYLGIYNLVNVRKGEYKDTLRNDIGEPPAILDTAITRLSAEAIEIYLQKKGYFNAGVTFSIDSLGPKKVGITYTAVPNQAYTVREYDVNIPDTAIRRLVQQYESLVDSGMNYDEYVLGEERERIASKLKNNGYAEFENVYIQYDADTALNNNQVDLTLRVEDPIDGQHTVYHFNNTFITIHPSEEDKPRVDADTIHYKGNYYFVDYEGNYHPRTFNNSTFLNKGQIYAETDRSLTYTRLGDLGIFKFITIDFKKNRQDSTLLDAYISLTPSKRQSLALEGELTLIGSSLGGLGGFTYTNKNLFRGGELFELRFRGGQESNLRQFEINSSIAFPQMLLPFNFTLGEYGMPRTKFSFDYLDQLEFNRYALRNYNFSFGYEWKETRSKSHYVAPIKVGVLRSVINPDFEDLLIAQGNIERVAELDPYFSLGSSYTYINGAPKLLEGGNFIYFKGSMEVSGNTLNLFHRMFGGPKNDSEDYYMVAGLRYPQYIRPEADVRFYRRTGPLQQLVIRLNAGAGYAYGNNPTLPYQRKFFMGGANSIRAWRTRTIGPGSFNYYQSQPTGDRNLEYFYRVGDIKLEGNVEYRFRILDDFFFAKLNGATFVDVGNIWDFADDDDSRVFHANEFYRQLAVGAGFGLRFDIDFLVFRLDFAAKVHDPQFSGKDRWVIGKIGDKAFKNKYNYNFFNLTLGIGYPF